jgi:hypothetical protein
MELDSPPQLHKAPMLIKTPAMASLLFMVPLQGFVSLKAQAEGTFQKL